MANEYPTDDRRTPEQIEESYLYWQSRTSSERFAETWRLSAEAYGLPIGDLRDGPARKLHRLPDGQEELIAEWNGPNPLQHPADNNG